MPPIHFTTQAGTLGTSRFLDDAYQRAWAGELGAISRASGVPNRVR
jgi:hypothetical protein